MPRLRVDSSASNKRRNGEPFRALLLAFLREALFDEREQFKRNEKNRNSDYNNDKWQGENPIRGYKNNLPPSIAFIFDWLRRGGSGI